MKNIVNDSIIKLCAKLNNMRIVGEPSKDEYNYLKNMIIDDMMKANYQLSREYLEKKLESFRLLLSENRAGLNGLYGFCLNKTVVISNKISRLIKEGNIEDIRKTNEYSTLFHEALHFVQNASSKHFYKGVNLLGLVEGATEKEAVEQLGKKRSTITESFQYNFKTNSLPYVPCIIVMQQLEELYGKGLVSAFTYDLNCDLVEVMRNDLGNELTKKIINYTNKCAKGVKTDNNISNIQNEIMISYFTKRVYNASTKEQANDILNKLLSYGNKRFNVFGNSDYEKYFNDMYEVLKAKELVDQNTQTFIKPKYYDGFTKEDVKDFFYNSVYDIMLSALLNYLEGSEYLSKNIEDLSKSNESFFNNNKPVVYDYIGDVNSYILMIFDNKVCLRAVYIDEKGLEKKVGMIGDIVDGMASFNYYDLKIDILINEDNKITLFDNKSGRFVLDKSNAYEFGDKQKYKLLRDAFEAIKFTSEKQTKFGGYKNYHNAGISTSSKSK